MSIKIIRKDLTSKELRLHAARSKDAGASRRMLALALVLDGQNRTQASQACGMDRQTLRDWVHRYNEEGLSGLVDRVRPGRPTLLTPAQVAEIGEMVKTPPDPQLHGVVRWRCVDLQAVIKTKYAVEMSEASVGFLLNKLGFRRLTARPYHPGKDAQAQEDFKKTLRPW